MDTGNLKKEFIDDQVVEFSKNGENKKLLYRHKVILNLVRKYCGKNDNILDIGCFDGKVLKNLEKLGYKNLYAADFSNVSRSSFKNTSINFSCYDIEKDNIPFGNTKFDAVIYTDVLEHLFSPESVLLDLKKRLNKNAKVFISVPNAGWFINGFLLTFAPSKLFISTAFGPWGHTYQFTFYEVKRLAEKLDYKVSLLSGARNENRVFKKGIKKIMFEMFLLITNPFVGIFPSVFSDHIFAVLENK